MRTLFTTALLLALVSSASAGSKFDMTGETNAKSSSVSHQTSDGRIIIALSARHMALNMSKADHPLAGMPGECTGHMIQGPPAATGGAICVYTNDAGDKAFVRVKVEGLTPEKGTKGTWVGLGGTGRFAGMSGSGGYVNTAIAEDGTYKTNITGTMQLP